MAIVKKAGPSSLPLTSADYVAQNLLQTQDKLNLEQPIRIDGSNVLKGALFQIGETYYYSSSATAITGTPSDYVKITPSVDTLTATASFASSLSGVTWNASYNGYYDSSDNLYIFDEQKALAATAISTIMTRYIKSDSNGDVVIGRDLDVTRNVSITGRVDGDLDIENDLNVGNDLDVSDNIYLNSKNINSSTWWVNMRTFATPGASPWGLAYDPSTGNLISCDSGTNLIYIHSGITSTISSSFATPASNISGLTIDTSTGNLISCDSTAGNIYIHSGITSTISSSFATPSSGCFGLTYDPSTGNLISCDVNTNLIYIHSGITSTISSSFATPAGAARGLAYDPSTGNLISCDSAAGNIYIHSGITADYAPPVSVFGLPYGLAYNSSNGNLISLSESTDRIYIWGF